MSQRYLISILGSLVMCLSVSCPVSAQSQQPPARQNQIDQSQQNKDRTLLDAVRKWDVDAARKLLDAGANPNARDGRTLDSFLSDRHKPLTALIEAVDRNEVEMVKLLLKRGADVNAKGSTDILYLCFDATPLMIAVGGMHLAGIIDRRFLIPRSEFYRAYMKERLAIAQYLLDHGAEVNATDYVGRTALMHSAFPGDDDTLASGDASLVGLLLDRGALMEAHDKQDGYTALMYATEVAARRGQMAALKLLLARRANINARDNFGETPLMLAVRDVSTLQFLLDKGADVRARDHQGWTALMYAIKENNEEGVRILQQHGAEINFKTSDGRTPLKLAEEKENQKIIQILQQAGARE